MEADLSKPTSRHSSVYSSTPYLHHPCKNKLTKALAVVLHPKALQGHHQAEKG